MIRIHRSAIRTGTFSLVLYHFNEFTPSRIVDAFCILAIDHFLYIQILITNQVKPVCQFPADFMMKIISMVPDFSMQIAQYPICSPAFFAAIFDLYLF